jgi:enoyl-CoA hydratase/carnithine racemase
VSAHHVGDVVIDADVDVVWARIDRPERRNAINLEVVAGLEAAVELAVSTEAKVLVVRGAGGTFSSGADLDLLADIADDEGTLHAFMKRFGRVLDTLEEGPFVSLAVVEGYAVAGGCELLLATDISIASTDARIGDRHAEYGLVPAAGGSVRLSEQLPKALAGYLLLTGDVIDGRRAAEIGLVSVAVAPAELDEAVMGLVGRLRTRSSDSLRAVKQLVLQRRVPGRTAALARELDVFLTHVRDSADAREGLEAFRALREPRFRTTKETPSGRRAAPAAPDGNRRAAPRGSSSSRDPGATG